MRVTKDKRKRARRHAWEFLALAAFVLVFSLRSAAAQEASAAGREAQLLADAQQWQRVAEIMEKVKARSADEEFLYGTALARLNQWSEAEAAFDRGEKLAPTDVRFAEERAGVAFHEKRYADAARLLQRALKLKPEDRYAAEFLATVYYLEGNLPAALKYWNRVGKPEIAETREDPPLRVDPALLDRAFVFAPQSELKLRDFLDTQTRLEGLGIFPQFKLDLPARDDGRFDAVLRAQELNGLGASGWEMAATLLVGLPFQGVHVEANNLQRQAINLNGFYRWDAQKRRVDAGLSMPFERRAAYRLNFSIDLRDENWVVRNSFTGTAPSLGSVNLRREGMTFELASHGSERFEWAAGGEVSHRDFRSVVAGSALSQELLTSGYALKQTAGVKSVLWRAPERRFKISGTGSSEAARLWSAKPEGFEKLAGSIGWQWLPRAQGNDFGMSHTVHAGKTFGTIPFDELTMLGLERDNDLPLRAHIGTRDGRKGSAPLGRDYVLSNWEMDKNIYTNGIVTVQVGPFVDSGAISDSNPSLGSHEWLWDVGAQAKLRVFGKGVAFSYGRDLRTGNNAIYFTVLPGLTGRD